MIRINIPKWGMPREEIPIGVFCKKDPNISFFDLIIPNELELLDMWNTNLPDIPIVDEMNKIRIPMKCIQTSSKSNKLYFGFVLATKGITDDIETQFPVELIAIKDKKQISKTGYVKIYRPKLEIVPPIDPIILTDEGSTPISFGFNYQGFGHVKIDLQVTTQEGSLISTSISLEDGIIHDLYTEGYFGKSEQDSEDNGTIKLKNEKDIVTKVADSILEIGQEEGDDDLTKAVQSWLEGIPLEEIGERLTPMINSLVNNLMRHNPTESMSIDDTTISIPSKHKLKMPIKRLKHIFRYKDSLENIYEPIEFWLSIEDQRSKLGLVEVKLGNHTWDEKKLMNLRRKK